MYLSEGIINNFIESIDEADMMHIEELDDEKAFDHLADLYKQNYGVDPSGVGVYLLRTKFNLGSEPDNKRFIPSALL